MSTLHIHNLVDHVHLPQWKELGRHIREMVHAPAFWAIVVMVLLLTLILLLALFGNPETMHRIPQHYGPIYPFNTYMM